LGLCRQRCDHLTPVESDHPPAGENGRDNPITMPGIDRLWGDLATDTPCVSISFGDWGPDQQQFSIKSTSDIWRASALRAELLGLLAEHVKPEEIY
jgi:hypothetical protein